MPAWQIAQTQISHSNPDQPFHPVANRFKHPADLSIDSLAQNNSQLRRANRMQSRDLSALAVEKDAAQKFLGVFNPPLSIERNFVFLLDFESWMS